MVEIVEPDWAQLVANQNRIKNALDTARDRTPARLSPLYGDALIYVRFNRDAGLRRRAQSVNALFSFLETLPQGFQGHVKPEGELAAVLRGINVSRGRFVGPIFQVEAVDFIQNPTSETLLSKWSKNYEMSHPIELLAYYDMQPASPEFIWIEKVRSFIEMNGSTSPFRRVWICDPAAKQILFTWTRN